MPTPTAEQIERARGIAEDWFGPESEGAWAWVLVDGKCLADDIAFALAAEAALALEQAAKACEERGESYVLDPENIDSLSAAVCNGCASVVRSLIPSSAPEKK